MDRATGPAQREGSTWRDLQNVRMKRGRLVARRPLTEASALSDMDGAVGAPTAVPFIGLFRAASRGIVVFYREGSDPDNLQVYATAVTGLNPVFVDALGTLAAGNSPPLFFGAENNRTFVIAHDESDITVRLQTALISDALALTLLTADLDRSGSAEPVFFRGVTVYLTYTWGWGFGQGTGTDMDRPAIIRFSQPGDPSTWTPEFYLDVGAAGDPILAAVGQSSRLLVFKAQEVHQILGDRPANFRVQVADKVYGLAGSHLWAQVGDDVFFWSLQGPRVIGAGGDSVDLAPSLELSEGVPENVQMPSDFSTAFAVHNPQENVVEFHFPNRDLGTTARFILHLNEESERRFTYDVLPFSTHCAGQLYAGAVGRPTGAPINLALAMNANDIDADWDNDNAVGDEIVEVWYSVNGGTFTFYTEFGVSGATQAYTLVNTGGSLWIHDDVVTVAVRYRRGTKYTLGYDNPVTGGWDAGPIATSTEDITVPSGAAEPTDAVGVCTTYPYGPKTYLRWALTWTQTEFTGGAEAQVSYGTDPDPNNNTIVTQDASDNNYILGDYLVSPGGSSTPIYVFVRQTLAGEASPSDWVAFDISPFTPSAGCVL